MFLAEEWLKEIDEKVRPLVIILNEFPGTHTFTSCGGHKKPLEISQCGPGKFWVNMYFNRTGPGWRSLELITHVVKYLVHAEGVKVKLDPWFNGIEPEQTHSLMFELSGKDCIELLTSELKKIQVKFK